MLSTEHNTEVFAAAAVIAIIVIIIGKDGKLKTTAYSQGEGPLLGTAALLPCRKLRTQRSVLPYCPKVLKKARSKSLCDIHKFPNIGTQFKVL